MKKILISLLATVVVFIGIIWASETRYTAEVVTIKEINRGTIIIENLSGRERQIEIPKIITELIQKNEQYFISYKKSRFSKWELEEIKPIET
ncbi:hypothetical protein PASE110613_00015 [Paenibacillus sediminis]|uniref:Uncharacterized protein n=1 Tax=Paenibacillus sediminis TaxID=664909 RepID=A0ABS4H187_9BACL|nr:hypothetical protein [Paenibacillus sediminis]MBP1936037.1 hypothetical protein [Paenibacillus sediminis]